jgi:hypothetical protein
MANKLIGYKKEVDSRCVIDLEDAQKLHPLKSDVKKMKL